MQAENILLEAKHEHMACVSIDFAAGQHQKVVPVRQVPNIFGSPEFVVVGQADAVQAQGFGPVYQVINADETVVGLGVTVGMQVYKQRKLIAPEME
jgi:hypothetical protein